MCVCVLRIRKSTVSRRSVRRWQRTVRWWSNRREPAVKDAKVWKLWEISYYYLLHLDWQTWALQFCTVLLFNSRGHRCHLMVERRYDLSIFSLSWKFFFFFVRVSSFFRKKFISKSVQLVKSQLKCINSRSNDGGLDFLVIKNYVSKV